MDQDAMNKFVISILGKDSPGIIAAVTRVFFEHEFTIEDVSQTMVQNQFSGIFIVSGPKPVSHDQLLKALQDNTTIFDLHFHIRDLGTDDAGTTPGDCESFVITTRGPDRKGLVSRITAVFAAHHVNVTQLRAVFRGGETPENNFMIYEVDIPLSTDQKKLRQALNAKAAELNLEISIQHKNIFEAMNRI